MAPFRFLSRAGTVAALVMATSNASAITARDVTDKMPKEERFGYLTGIVDTLSYQELLSGNRERAMCISDAFYKDQAGMEKIINALHAFPDKPPVAIVIVTMNKACAK